MRELSYVSTDANGRSYSIFPYYVTTNTSILFKNLYVPVQPAGSGRNFCAVGPGRFQSNGNGVNGSAPVVGDTPNFELIFGRWSWNLAETYYAITYTNADGINGDFEFGNGYMKLNGTIVATGTTYTGETITMSEPFYLFNHFNSRWNNWIMNGHCGQVIFYENGVETARFTPYIDDYGVAGFFDENNQTMIYSSGNAWIAGPDAKSILVEASKATLAATGDTSNIIITCDNAWTVSGNTFLTLSSTGDTGGTTITAIAPSYSGVTERTDVLTFTDSVTGDEAELTIKQKKYTSGQPLYLGADEIAEIYLGADSITEAYLGEDLVYSSGPFQGVKINPKNISFTSESLTASITIKSSESWTMTTPAWISASSSTGDTGVTIITISATTQTATTTGRIEVSTTNYSASASVNYYNVEFLDYVYAQNLGSSSNKYLVTNLYPTPSTNGEIIGKLEGYDTGLVLVGQPNQSDSKDWRFFFPKYTNWYMDTSDGTSEVRLNGPLNITDAYSQIDIKFGNHYMRNVLNGAFLTASTVSGPLLQVPINICMGVIKIKELKLWEGDELIFDGKAAIYNNSYGLFDIVGGSLLTTNNFVITGETSNKTLTISNMGTINGDVETKQITIDGNMSVSVENDSTQETFTPVSTAGYTSSYSNGTITISGPFGNTASLAFYYSTNTAPCLQTNQAETVTFVNNAASTAFDDSALYTDQECDCYQQGGTWEDGGCTYPEPEDPCIADPCMCDPNPDECYCIQQGGTWDGSQCIMPE